MNMNEALQQSLYDKLTREQDKYRDWLKGQPPEEILHHSYEYTVREDILMSMEELTLSEAETRALLLSPSPMAILYDKFSDLERLFSETPYQAKARSISPRAFRFIRSRNPHCRRPLRWCR